MVLELVAAWFIASSGLGCAAATPDGVVSLVWCSASAALVGGEAPTSCELAALTSTSCGGGSTTPRGASAGPPCARRAGVPLMHKSSWIWCRKLGGILRTPLTMKHPTRVPITWLSLATDLSNHIPTWIEVSTREVTREVLDLAIVRPL